MRTPIIATVALSLSACVSGYSQFYTAMPETTLAELAQRRAAPPPTSPSIERAQTMEATKHLEQRGYEVIGYSSFNSGGGSESERNAIAQGKKVGADLVLLVNPTYTGSVTNQLPITTPTTQTSQTSSRATASGSGGSATAYGNSTTTTYGTTTTYVPITVNRYNYAAVFLIKRTFILGALWRDLTNDERSVIQSNSGVYVESVVDDTPAFRGDLLPGDVIKKIDGTEIYGGRAASDAIVSRRGQNVTLTILRKGKLVEQQIKLDP